MQSSRTRPVPLALLAVAGIALNVALPVASADPHKKTEASGSANVGSPLVKYRGAGPAAVRVVKRPSPRASMFWSWRLLADVRSTNGTSKETKFAFPGGVPAGRNPFTGPRLRRPLTNVVNPPNTVTLTGNRLSTATGTGNGTSTAGLVGGKMKYTVSWNVTAGGTLGPIPPVSWSSRMNGKDPFYITELDLDEMNFLDKTELDLFFPVGISDVAFNGDESGFSFDVEFGINGEIHSLLRLIANESGVTLSGPGSQYDVSIYSLASLHEEPAFDAPTISIASLESMFANDLSDGVLDLPAFIGFEIHDVAVADIIANDTFFSAASEAWAGEAAVPTPGTMTLLGLGGLLATRRRR